MDADGPRRRVVNENRDPNSYRVRRRDELIERMRRMGGFNIREPFSRRG